MTCDEDIPIRFHRSKSIFEIKQPLDIHKHGHGNRPDTPYGRNMGAVRNLPSRGLPLLALRE